MMAVNPSVNRVRRQVRKRVIALRRECLLGHEPDGRRRRWKTKWISSLKAVTSHRTPIRSGPFIFPTFTFLIR